ncbi:hypothetical protein CPC08DRAFT_770425 [Agrocybe pediades]|nr:hypothetical protein CPC08DRAFT_770425 [Agrocybe pediades]
MAPYATSEEYLAIVRHCNKIVKDAINNPASDLDQVMHSLESLAARIFETRSRGNLDPEVTRENHLIHKFAGHHSQAKKKGQLGEMFRRKMVAIVRAEHPYPAAFAGPTPAQPPAAASRSTAVAPAPPPPSRSAALAPVPPPPSRSAALAPIPPPPSRSAAGALAATTATAVPPPSRSAGAAAKAPSARPTPAIPSNAQPSQFAAGVASVQPSRSAGGPASRPPPSRSAGAPTLAPPPRTLAVPDTALLSQTTQAAQPSPAVASSKPPATTHAAPTHRRVQTPPLGHVAAVAKKLKAQLASAEARGSANPPQTATNRPTSKGKQKEIAQAGPSSGEKRKREEDNGKPGKRPAQGTGVFYLVPCDACAAAKVRCEKKVGIKPRKGTTPSCVACARLKGRCQRSSTDLHLVDKNGNRLPDAAHVQAKPANGEEDELEGEDEEAAPPAKRRNTKIKSPAYVEESADESEHATRMDVDAPPVTKRKAVQKAASEVRHVSWARETAPPENPSPEQYSPVEPSSQAANERPIPRSPGPTPRTVPFRSIRR